MIPFFRKIRKKLADQNRFLQYSRYAIGEILLVVIGILIALQVNNWNEGRKQMNQKEFYIKSLFSDYKYNLEYLIKRNNEVRQEKENIHIINEHLGKKETTLDTILKVAKEEISLMIYSYAYLNENTFKTLQTTGHFENFEPWLQKTLQELHFMHNDFYRSCDGLNEDMRVVITNFLKVFPRNNMAEIISESLFDEVEKSTTTTDKISAMNSLLWIKGGAYHSMLRRAEPIEEKTRWLLDTLEVAYPFLKN